ncbi:MAG: hypothetical protein NC911_01045 [Candidatus Omnitrophica bacterium]|nr:hypothetical protein [Candidatus Omnitrophota bacterium]
MSKKKWLWVITHHWRLKIYAFLIGSTLWFYVLSSSGDKGRFFQTVSLKSARGIPVKVDSQASDRWEIIPGSVDIYFVSRTKHSFFSDKFFRPTVHPPDEEIAESQVPVSVSADPAVSIIKVEPEKVLVRRRK